MDKNILNLTIKEIFTNWKKANNDIFDELIILFENKEKYKKYLFADSSEPDKNLWTGLRVIAMDVFKVINKNDRLIYFGLTLILISFFLFLIKITS